MFQLFIYLEWHPLVSVKLTLWREETSVPMKEILSHCPIDFSDAVTDITQWLTLQPIRNQVHHLCKHVISTCQVWDIQDLGKTDGPGTSCQVDSNCFPELSVFTSIPTPVTFSSSIQNSHFSLCLFDHLSPLSDPVSHLAAMVVAICAVRMRLLFHHLPSFSHPEILGLKESGASDFWASCHWLGGFHILGQVLR